MPNHIRRDTSRPPDSGTSPTPPAHPSALARPTAAPGPTRSVRGRRNAPTLAEATAGQSASNRRRAGGARGNVQTEALPRLPQGAASQLAPPNAATARQDSDRLFALLSETGTRYGALMSGRRANGPMDQLARSILSSASQNHWLSPGYMHASSAPALSPFILPGLDRSALVLARPENVGVDAALENVEAWYVKLPASSDVRIPKAQATALVCPISFVPFAEMTHPVAVYAGQVVHVFEALDLLMWMQSSMQLEARLMPMATNPLDRKPLALNMLKRAVVEPDHA